MVSILYEIIERNIKFLKAFPYYSVNLKSAYKLSI
jgi:hypothetical protein